MIGTSISNIVLAFQQEARKVLKEAKGDPSRVVGHALAELKARGLFGAEDLKRLEASFAEAFEVLAGKGAPSRILASARKRHVLMVADPKSSEVARALGELCVSVVTDAAAGPRGAEATSSTVITGGEKVLYCALIGAGVGGEAGGLAGAVIGAAVGAAVGACVDNLIITVDDGKPVTTT